MAVATALFPFIIEALIGAFGWRTAYAVLGGLVALTLLPPVPGSTYARLHRLLAADMHRLKALSGYAFAHPHWQTAAPEPA